MNSIVESAKFTSSSVLHPGAQYEWSGQTQRPLCLPLRSVPVSHSVFQIAQDTLRREAEAYFRSTQPGMINSLPSLPLTSTTCKYLCEIEKRIERTARL